jgi:hypothetical protein
MLDSKSISKFKYEHRLLHAVTHILMLREFLLALIYRVITNDVSCYINLLARK